MAKTKVHGEYLDPSVISGQTQVTAVGADSVLIFDATDNALKKALLSDVIETVGSTPSFTSATISASDPVLNIARTSNYSYKIGSLANDTFVIQSNETGDASYAPLIEIDSYAHQGTIFLKGDANGRLGLLESSPDAPLHITATGAASQGTIKLQGTSSHIGFHQANDTFKTWIGHYNTANHGSNTDLNIKAGYNGGGNIRITADGDTTHAQLYIEGSTGNVGIGLTDPGSSLSVGPNTTHSNNRITIFSDDYNYGQVRIGSSTSEASLGFMRSTTQANVDNNAPSGGNDTWAIGLGVWGANFGIGSNSTQASVVEWTSSGHMLPGANNTYDLGSTAKAWRNIYTNDLNLSNMPSEGVGTDEQEYEATGNDVDGTNGSWTIQEGENDLFIINRLNGKKYKFDLTEVEE